MAQYVQIASCREKLECVSLGLEDLAGPKLALAKEVESYSDQTAQNY